MKLRGSSGVACDGWFVEVDLAGAEVEFLVDHIKWEGEIRMLCERFDVCRVERGQPGVVVGVGRLSACADFVLLCFNRTLESIPCFTVLLQRDEGSRWVIGFVPIHRGHRGISEKGGEGVEILL